MISIKTKMVITMSAKFFLDIFGSRIYIGKSAFFSLDFFCMKTHHKPQIWKALGVQNHFYHSESTFEIGFCATQLYPRSDTSSHNIYSIKCAQNTFWQSRNDFKWCLKRLKKNPFGTRDPYFHFFIFFLGPLP